MMVADIEIVRDRESRIRVYLADLREMGRTSEEDFVANRERQYAVLHALQLAIEASADIAMHICAADTLGVPSSYAEAFDLLERSAVVDTVLAGDLRRMVGFRNRIVHLYVDVDVRQVHGIVQNRLGDFERYLAAIEQYLRGKKQE